MASITRARPYRRLRFRVLGALALMFVTIAALVGAWQLGLARFAASHSESKAGFTSPPPVSQNAPSSRSVAAEVVAPLEGVSVEIGPGSAETSQMVAVLWDGGYAQSASLYDGNTGLIVATLRVGSSPLLLIRSSVHKTIVVDALPGSFVSRLYALDSLESFETSQSTELTSRIGYSSYIPGMTLSHDQIYLAVQQRDNRDEITGCQQGGVDLVCDDNRFAFVDLNTMTIVGEVALAQGCGRHKAYPAPGGFAVVCANSGYVAEVSPRGAVLREADFSALPGMQLNPARRYPTVLMFAAVVDGKFIVYRSDGLMIAEDGTSARAVPEGEFIDEWFPIAGDRFIARFRKPTEGYTVFDLRTFEVIATHYVPLDSIAPAGEDGLIWTLGDGVVVLRDAESGEIVSDVRIEVGEDAYLLP